MGHYSDDYETPEQIEYRKARQALEDRMERLLLAALKINCDNDKDLVLAKRMAECLVSLLMKESGARYNMTRDL
jgi:hypothetical protein